MVLKIDIANELVHLCGATIIQMCSQWESSWPPEDLGMEDWACGEFVSLEMLVSDAIKENQNGSDPQTFHDVIKISLKPEVFEKLNFIFCVWETKF